MEQQQKDVQEYYGETLKSTDDLKTSACCPIGSQPSNIQPYLKNIHEDVLNKFYGCGSPIPENLEGCTVLDLGCGTGRDCYILSQLVGETGHVIGVDMTDEQLDVARKSLPWHMEKFGYKQTNITFHKSLIEDLSFIEDASIDVVISNCVINLSADKETVFKEIFRVLKTGGELYFSDVYADRRIPKELMADPVLLGECLSGALYTEDFRRILTNLNCPDVRAVSTGPIHIEDGAIKTKLEGINFSSVTYRTFKVGLEDKCEDFGHKIRYTGNENNFTLDDHHTFKKNEWVNVCGNTANMITETRFKNLFDIEGDFKTHKGLFDCSTEAPTCKTTTTGACC